MTKHFVITGHKLIATAGRDRLVHVFDMNNDFCLMQTVDDHSASITSVKFNGMCVTRVAESKCHGKWFEPRGISYLFGVIVRVKVVFRKTVVGD